MLMHFFRDLTVPAKMQMPAEDLGKGAVIGIDHMKKLSGCFAFFGLIRKIIGIGIISPEKLPVLIYFS